MQCGDDSFALPVELVFGNALSWQVSDVPIAHRCALVSHMTESSRFDDRIQLNPFRTRGSS